MTALAGLSALHFPTPSAHAAALSADQQAARPAGGTGERSGALASRWWELVLLANEEAGAGTAAGGVNARPSPAVDVLLKAVGDTPIMKTKKWAVERTRTIQGLVDFIKKFLKLMASEQLFIYVNQSFAPSPDQEVGTLYECFGSDGKLVLHYCKTQAWG
ncbi:ubiquitin-like protein ATG12 [Athene cunicularia]|uniref:ubiquitin-like protein ATG12 n=1 Tax=Athene cunicularia TaxID=194338 RepID=UPI000EF662B7|nr:ubiquitin-like protein ATG12 [Athene cunicularia]